MKVLLVYPKYPISFWGFQYSLPFIRCKATLPPLGLLTVAAMFPKEWEVRLADQNIGPISDKDILWANVVFISAMLAQSEATLQILEYCHSIGKKTIAGGPLFTADPDKFEDLVDCLILNEAEITFKLFLRDWQNGGIESVQAKYSSSEFCNIRETPIPRWKLLGRNFKKYSSMSIQFGRGCPYDCEFCNVTTLCGRKMRLKGTEQIIAELQALYEMGWRDSVFFVDDNFIGNVPKAKEALVEIANWQKERAYPFPLYTQSSMNLADDVELLELMVEAGFDRVFIGIETMNKASLEETGKTQNLQGDLLRRIRNIQNAGIEVMGGFIVGFDADTEDVFRELADFIQLAGIPTAMVGIMQAWPGTKLWKRLLSEERLLDEATGNNADGTCSFIPKNMTVDELIEGHQYILHELFLNSKKYGERLAVLLKECPQETYSRKPTFEGAYAFLLSVLKIGIFSEARGEYWRSLRLAFKENPKAMHQAVKHWIFQAHFREVSQQIVDAK